MSAYRGTAEGRDRARAIAAVVAVHVALAWLIVSGLGVRSVRQVVDRLATIDIRIVQPPPPPSVAQRQPAPRPRVAEAPAPPARKADPTPMVAPATRLPSPNPIVAAQVAGSGASASSGSAAPSNGTGTGGPDTGSGSGSTPDYSRFTPAQLIANIPSFEYRHLAATGIPSGQIGVMIRVEPEARLANCRVARSSGDPGIDALVCQLTLRYVRFDPARDPDGRPVAQDVTYFPSWRRR